MNRNAILLMLLFLFSYAASAQKNKKTLPPDDSHLTSADRWRENYFSGEPLRIGNRVQFLFDDYMVEDRFGLERAPGPIEKSANNPLSMGEDKPWETSTTSWGGVTLRHVLYDPKDKLFKGWYVVYRYEKGIETGYNYSTLYAESEDGIKWRKPELDYFVIDGRKTNYVLHKSAGTALMEDVRLNSDAADPEKRFVGLAKMIPPGETIRCIVMLYSPDGKKWTLAKDPVLFRGANDGSYSLVHDDARGQWLLYRRAPTNALVRPALGAYAGNPMNPEATGLNIKRRVSVTVSKDLKTWTYPRGIRLMDEVDDAPVGVLGNGMDIDWATVTLYEGMYFGFIHLMDNLTMTTPRSNQLMWSRDGLRWERLPHRPLFIANGAPGEWDAGSIGSISMIPTGNKIHVYYSGGNVTQGEKRIPRFIGTGLAVMDKDRFIGQQAGHAGGYLLTRQFILEGSRIEINARSQVKQPAPGWGTVIKAELLDAPADHVNAQPYPGFSMEDCDGITATDCRDQALTWKGSADVSSLRGKPVYIRFYLQNTTLYTFRVSN